MSSGKPLSENRMFRNLSTDALGFWAPQNEQIELALSFGFKAIDVDVVDFGEQVQSRGLAKARRLIDSAKVQVGIVRLPISLEAEETAYRQKAGEVAGWAKLAEDLNCQRAFVSIAPASEVRPMKENFELHRSRLTEIAAILAPHKVRLGVEFNALPAARQGAAHEFIHDLDGLSTLIKSVGRDNVGWVIDCWQLHAAGARLDAVAAIPADKIVLVKFADAPSDVPRSELKEEHRLLPGQGGALDLVGLVSHLNAANYDGPIMPVLHFGQFHGRRRDQAIRQIAQAMDEVWRGAGLPPALVARSHLPISAQAVVPDAVPDVEVAAEKEEAAVPG